MEYTETDKHRALMRLAGRKPNTPQKMYLSPEGDIRANGNGVLLPINTNHHNIFIWVFHFPDRVEIDVLPTLYAFSGNISLRYKATLFDFSGLIGR